MPLEIVARIMLSHNKYFDQRQFGGKHIEMSEAKANFERDTTKPSKQTDALIDKMMPKMNL